MKIIFYKLWLWLTVRARQLAGWWQLLAFVVYFVVVSASLGKLIIGTNLLQSGGFWVYGGAGKALLFAIVVLVILIRKQPRRPLGKSPFERRQLIWASGSLASGSLLLASLHRLTQTNNASLLITSHLLLWLMLVLMCLAIFGRNLLDLARQYRREVTWAVVVASLFYGLFNLIYKLWSVLAGIVLWIVKHLLDLTGLKTTIVPPRTLLLDKFGVTIEQYCSGIESLALFTGLFTIIAVLDWQRFDKHRLVLAFGLGLLGLFVCNILRVYLLILAGYYINPTIAFTLFHSYAGMILFIIYYWFFWRFSYGWVLCHRQN